MECKPNRQDSSISCDNIGVLAGRACIGIIGGFLLLILFTYSLWFVGLQISSLHWFVFPIGFLLSGIGLSRTKFLQHSAICFLIVVSVGLFSFVCRDLYGLNWDGMLGHKEYVMALEDGWNPVADPMYEAPIGRSDWEREASRWKIWWGGFNVRFGYVYQAIVAKAVGNTEAGKASNLLFLFLPFFASLYSTRHWGLRGHLSFLISIAIALNPVWILQAISYWEDAQFAGLSVASVLFALSVRKDGDWIRYLGFAGLLILMVGAKRSGIAFSAVLLLTALMARFLRNPFSRKSFLFIVVAGFSVLVIFGFGVLFGLWKTHGLFPYKLEQVLHVNSMQHLFDEKLVSRIPELSNLFGPFQFLATVFSEGTMVPADVSLKLPFWITKQEIDLYSHIFSAPWFGGFGPLYGSCLLMVLLGYLFFLPSLNGKQWKEADVWLWVLFFPGILCVMPAFFPRWIPFLWLMPFLILISMLVPQNQRGVLREKHVSDGFVNLGFGSFFWLNVSKLSISLLLLSSVLVASLNFLGHVRSSAVVHEQLEFAERYLPKPIKVFFDDFPSNRDWLDSKGIEWEFLEYGWKQPNFMMLGRTNTYVILEDIDFQLPFVVGGKEWSSIESWGRSLDRRIGYRERWNAWIKKTIVLRKKQISHPRSSEIERSEAAR